MYVYKGRINQGEQEKGVDVNLAIDLIELTYDQQYDTAIIFSQDWDFEGAIKMAKKIANNQGRHLEFESVYPFNPSSAQYNHGIPGTTKIGLLKAEYDLCLDSRDYR